ncbi:M20 family metallo-hydrolase [Clostridium sp.]
MDVQKLQDLISEKREQMIADMIEMSSIPAVNPKMGGTGEYARMQWIMRWFDKRQIPYEVYEVPDKNVKEGVRLNVVVTIPGTKLTDRSLWFISHVDTVGPGDLSAWDTDPFTPTVKDGRIYGLGCEDNSQSVITTMYACEALFAEHIQIDRNLRFYYASDEETGSDFGMKALLDKGLIQPKDEAIVPDGGSADGSFVEIAEKSQIWLKFTINGKTSHAAMPHLGINACYIGMKFGVELEDALKTRYDKEDTMFNPPMSTFEVTQKFANVESPNVMPGKDVFCMDLRILPDYSVDEVMEFIQGLMKQYEAKYPGININVEYLTRVVAPPPTSPESKVVQSLMEAISETGTKAYCGGIGGGTCGAILREKNIPAVIWSTLDDMCHTPNEYVVIDNLVRDTKIYLAALARYEE